MSRVYTRVYWKLYRKPQAFLLFWVRVCAGLVCFACVKLNRSHISRWLRRLYYTLDCCAHSPLLYYYRRTDHHKNNSTWTFQSLSLISRYYCDITLPPSCQYFVVLFLLPFFVYVYGCFHHICCFFYYLTTIRSCLCHFFSISSRRMKFPERHLSSLHLGTCVWFIIAIEIEFI